MLFKNVTQWLDLSIFDPKYGSTMTGQLCQIPCSSHSFIYSSRLLSLYDYRCCSSPLFRE